MTHVSFVLNRGRYDLKLFPSFLQLHGKTFDYKIPYQTILRLFLLTHKDGRQMYFVVNFMLMLCIVFKSDKNQRIFLLIRTGGPSM